MPIVSAHVAHALAAHADTVFGVMGNGNAYLLDAVERDTDMTFVAVRHEAGGVVAADVHQRASGRLAVATATYGAGFTNTLTPLAEAVQARVPLVLVVGDEPTTGARPWDVDQVALAAAVGARTWVVGLADPAGTTLDAIEHALAHRTAVVVALPYDIAAADAGPLHSLRELALPSRVPPTASEVDAVAHLLAGAERPVILAGRGAWLAGAGAAIDAVADAVGALTTASALGRGLVARDEHDLGVAGGFGAEAAMALVHEADVALVVGASLNQFTMRFGELFGEDAHVVQVDVSTSATNARVDTFVHGDARLTLEAIAAALDGIGEPAAGWRASVDAVAARRQERGDGIAADGRLDPRTAAARIGELLPADRVVVTDGGHFLGWANMHWPVAAPDRHHMVGTAYQSIGLGFPSVPGAAVAHPDATIVLATGDGGGLMALADLESAVRVAGGRGVATVWNDAAYAAETTLYGGKGLAEPPMLIPEVDFASLATAVGAEGVVVRTMDDLERLGTWAQEDPATRRFLLLDLRISREVVAPYQEEIMRVNQSPTRAQIAAEPVPA
ncbi:thiamine pyrophosphate-binding protein [Agrococcus sp. SGAir0287]|uniref:thiamine pyrophosphate-binding protein n=1 Tax=Agrococcus sp. SGAir0287 TaxID=2070347 RepID=UPI0010CCEE14|nr:thiamine pyrophosphate-binding protein [Agrococcus sp. SGAir0287]QCR18212.1 thiamine pyrophosphate-binding protein [Agrococcus sp. SGAir0287]